MTHRLNLIFEKYIHVQRSRYVDWKEADCPVFDLYKNDEFYKTVHLSEIKKCFTREEIWQLNLKNLYEQDRLESLWERIQSNYEETETVKSDNL